MPKPSVGASMFITLALLPIIYWTVYRVLAPGSSFSVEIQAMVVGTVIGSLLGAVAGFWLGGTYADGVKPNVPNPVIHSSHDLPTP